MRFFRNIKIGHALESGDRLNQVQGRAMRSGDMKIPGENDQIRGEEGRVSEEVRADRKSRKGGRKKKEGSRTWSRQPHRDGKCRACARGWRWRGGWEDTL